MSVAELSGLDGRPHGFGFEKFGVPGGDSACKSDRVLFAPAFGRLSESGGLGKPIKLSGLFGDSSRCLSVS
jgi:hypothetical protein